MSAPITTHRKADNVSLGLLLVGLGILLFFNNWWPWILLVIGTALVARQYLRGRHYDMAISGIIFGGLFLFFYFGVSWSVLMPVIFTLGGIYLIFREYFVTKERFGQDKIEDATIEIADAEREEENR